MDLKQLLTMLQSVSGPNSSGEYTARCPAHDDQTASLTVTEKVSERDGKRKLFLCCHAGCQNDAVMGALGIKPRDLIVNPDQGAFRSPPGPLRGSSSKKKTEKGAAKTQQTETVDGIVVHTVGENQGAFRSPPGTPSDSMSERKDELRPDWDHPDRVYSYTDEDGKELFQVVRLHYLDGKPGKTFRQRMKPTEQQKADAKAGKIKIGKSGYVNSVPAEIRDVTLYRLPKVIQAIKEGRPVFVVEGEKDVETLERLGHVATCNPGGAGKWREGYSRRLIGADVIILPDNDGKGNDYTGQNHALDVALKLQQCAKRVRLVNIAEACADLPEKGDITDMVEIMGDVGAMDALARQVAATRDFDPNAVPFWLSPMEQAEKLYGTVKGYGVANGCISQVTGESTKPLCDFVVLPRMELTKDDGVNTSLNFVLDGWNQSGAKLGRVSIPAKDLDGMNWVTEKWGMDACVAPGSTTKAKVAWAIKKVGQLTAKRVTEYNHTGWRKIGGKWCYLYHGGAIGLDGVTVNMNDALKTYRLDGGGAEGFDQIPYPEAAKVSLRVQETMKEEIGIALLGTIYLAPLREFMSQTDIVPAFALFLYGESGTHKSTAASLALSHFGNFHAKNPPTSFADTGNNIREKAFLVKDMPILVDDYHPTLSVQERRAMAATAQTLSRAFGDGADRGRLNADSTVKAKRPPRSVAIITGEDLPAIGASGLARFFILDIDEEDIPVGKTLTEMQELARKGYLQRAMRGYILWLLKQADGMPDRLHNMFLQYREDIHKDSSGQHDRAPETVACILIGYALMLNYFRDLGLFDTKTAGKMLAHARAKLLDTSRKQTTDMESEKPTRIFLDSLAELMNSKQAAVKDLTVPDAKDPPPTERMIGYMDADYYYLLPNVAFGAVQKLCREQGVEFPVSLKALMKHLRTDGVLRGCIQDGEGKGTKKKRIGDKVLRLLWIPAGELNGPKVEVEQTRMTEVDSGVLPEEFR
jgi:hypothetical protein